jgi:hypothetical protein
VVPKTLNAPQNHQLVYGIKHNFFEKLNPMVSILVIILFYLHESQPLKQKFLAYGWNKEEYLIMIWNQ